jgi:hypothetical protein
MMGSTKEIIRAYNSILSSEEKQALTITSNMTYIQTNADTFCKTFEVAAHRLYHSKNKHIFMESFILYILHYLNKIPVPQRGIPMSLFFSTNAYKVFGGSNHEMYKSRLLKALRKTYCGGCIGGILTLVAATCAIVLGHHGAAVCAATIGVLLTGYYVVDQVWKRQELLSESGRRVLDYISSHHDV